MVTDDGTPGGPGGRTGADDVTAAMPVVGTAAVTAGAVGSAPAGAAGGSSGSARSVSPPPPSPPSSPKRPSTSPSDGDWPAAVTDRIESVVGTVRDKTAVPATTAARLLVFGILGSVLGLALLLLMVIAVVRVLDVYLPFHPMGRRVWITDAIVSAIFLLLGAFVWSKRRPGEVSP